MPLGLLCLVSCLALALRLLVAAATPMPREDGVNYLWMAERFAAGEPCAALSEVFSPLLPMGIAMPLWLSGAEALGVAQLFLAGVGALLVFPAYRLGEQLRPGLGVWAALLAGFGSARAVQLGAAVYTEPMFLLCMAWGLERGLARRYWAAGVCCGLGFWLRPEAPLLVLALCLADRRAWRAALPLAVAVGLLALWRGGCGHGFDPVPKLAFIRAHNVATPGGQWLHPLEVPGIAVEALGFLLPLVLIGLWWQRPRTYLWLWGLAILVICAYVPRWRFLVAWEFLAWPLAALGLRQLPRPGAWLALLVVVVGLQLATGGTKANRVAERQLARYLAARLEPGAEIATDLTRLRYFAGLRPLPPRHHSAAELLAMARSARFLVLRTRRSTTAPVLAELTGWRPIPLPVGLQEAVRARGMTVMQPPRWARRR